MCGVAAIFGYAGQPVERSELDRIRDAMAARGPDGAGSWYGLNGRIGLAHRRLAIIDLSERAAQPMLSADGRLAVSFNGEIYNYPALRRELEGQGVRFNSDSDTEVLLHLYRRDGIAMPEQLRGMFAFALWDVDHGGLLLARDPYGIKPLYYADDGRILRVASQLKALIAGGAIPRQTDPAAVVGFCLWGSVPEPFTLRQAVRALPAGCTLWVDGGGVGQPRRYAGLAELWRRAADHPATADPRAVAEALRDSVRHHLLADVPVGVFLSAGIDSGSVVGLMRDAGQDTIRSVTLGFAEFAGQARDEVPLAERIAAHHATEHRTRRVDRTEFRADLPKILQAMDQPSIDGVNTWFVAKAAREAGLKVALSGVGGDELLGGYPSFRDIPRWVRTLALPARVPGLAALNRRAVTLARRCGLPVNPKLAGLLRHGGSYAGAYRLRRGLFLPEELPALLPPDLLEDGLERLAEQDPVTAALTPGPGTPYARVATLEASLYLRNQLLRDTDWSGMAHSLEVRTPLVDIELLRRLAPLLVARPPGIGKQWLARSPRRPLPEAIAQRPKTGFETPVGDWLQRETELQTWRRIPLLNRPGTHWSRRWAYTVLDNHLDDDNPIAVNRG